MNVVVELEGCINVGVELEGAIVRNLLDPSSVWKNKNEIKFCHHI